MDNSLIDFSHLARRNRRRDSSRRKTMSSSDATTVTTSFSTLDSKKKDLNEKSPRKLSTSMELTLSPVHLAQDSLFSSSSGWTNYSGFFNLAVLLLIISNGRVALENLIKYGILISPLQWFQSFLDASPSNMPNIAILILSNITILTAFGLEIILAKKRISNTMGFILYIILILAHITIPAFVIITVKSNPLFSSQVLSLITIQTLKLISYGHVNYWCRLAVDDEHNEDLKVESSKFKAYYPKNLTLADLYYFICAPTLCYELKFPKTPGRRKSFIIKRVVEIIMFTFVIFALCQQWIMPLVKNSLAPFSKMDLKRIIERLLKLAIPNHFIWLIFFYLYFHSILNLIAEILRFADRKFYLDFWNSGTVGEFWKSWNIPVHRWCVRHVYKPFVRNGYTKFNASLAVFFVSAFFHEYLVSVPLSMFRLWAFYGMLGQLPLCFLTDHFMRGGRAGNIIMWLSLILGQPIAILMYVHDWYVINYPAQARILESNDLPLIPQI